MSGEDDRGPFGERLAHLISTVHPADRGPYSYGEIAAGIAAQGGPPMSKQYIQQLAKGTRGRGGVKSQYVHALAQFFGVPDAYFHDGEVAERVDAQIAELTTWRDEEAAKIAERVMELSPPARRTVSDLIDSLRAYESQPRDSRRRRKATASDDT
ncbi:XRE family transcriptional regulator [Amycolatopsis pigmentata]|uniref:XRE family transcriptional regulator n=1 Tax=Amycolatopsis pigmentata TaxID=450801 RepID=A0ABW5FL03_9PSEU